MVKTTKKTGSINKTIISWFLLLSLTPLICISMFNYFQTSNSLIVAAKNELQHSAQLANRFVNNWIEYRYKDIHSLSQSPNNLMLIETLSTQKKELNISLEEFVQSDTWFNTTEQLNHALHSFMLTYDYVYDVFLIDEQSNIVFSLTKENDLGQNLDKGELQNTLFAKNVSLTLTTGKPQFSGIERYGPSNNTLAAFFTAPLIGKYGHVEGVIAVQVTLDYLFDYLTSSIVDGSSLSHYFVGTDGKVRTPIKTDRWDEVLTYHIDTIPVQDWINDSENFTPEKYSSLHYIGPNGDKVIGNQQVIQFDNFNWLLVSEIDFKEANTSAETIQKITVIFVIFTSWLVILISYTLAKRLTTPLTQLTEYSEDIKHGIQHGENISEIITSNNEIGILADAFNAMVETQRDNQQALRRAKVLSEKALAELAEQKYALDQHAIVEITNPQGAITFVNEKFAQISGYDVKELIGMNHRMLKSGVHGSEFFVEMYDEISNGNVWNGEICNRAKNGDFYWVDTTIVPFLDKHNRPLSYIAMRTDITQRKNTELYLEENSKKLELIINATQVGIWDWKITTGEITCNNRWFEMFGYIKDDFSHFSDKQWQSMIHPDDLLPFKASISEVMKGNAKSFDFELRVKHKNGSWIWVVDGGKIVEWDYKDCPVRMIGTLLDISKLKETEQGLARVQAFSTGIFNSVADGIITIDKYGVIQSLNPAAEEMYGFSQQEIQGKDVTSIIPQKYPKAHLRDLKDIKQSNIIDNAIELEGLRKSGGIFPVELTISQVNIENEVYFTALSRDITLRKKEEEQQQKLYQKSQVKLAISSIMSAQESLQKRMDNALIEAYKLGELGLVSQSTLILADNNQLAHSIFSSYGKLDQELIVEDDYIKVCLELSQASLISGELNYHTSCLNDDCQKAHPYNHSHYTLPLIDKSVSGYELLGMWVIHTSQDYILDDNTNDIFIEISNILTAAIIRENARDLLRQASITADQNSRLKSEFLASMSHEIRTPMNGVLGMLGLLINSKLTQEQEHKAYIAKTSAESLLTLINDILDFSKVEAGKIDLELIDFNLRGMFGDFAESIAHKAQEKGLEIVLDVTQIEQSMVKGDPGRIRQILTNLVGNAIKFTHEGEVIIRAKTQIKGDQLVLCCDVQDTGIGIPDDKVINLFSAFTQVDASTTREYGGTGLGLSISKKLAQLMKGDITVSSTLNIGSVFRLEIVIETSDKSELVIPTADIKSLNLLIVDDNSTNREVLRGQLEHWGATVTEARNAEEALDICEKRYKENKEQFFDVAFLDMQMPVMDGAELGRILNTDERYSTMKLVMMTSISQGNEADYFAKLGFSAYFPKPATTSDIFDALLVVTDGGIALEQAKPLVTHDYLQSLSHPNKYEQPQLDEKSDSDLLWPEKARLLLVEDNRINQVVALGILNEFNLSADVAANGLEALAALESAPKEDPYTLVLMDCQMPEMDGYQATTEIRQGKVGTRNINIPIIAMTANAMEGDKQKCLDIGMSDYLSKPVDSNNLLTKLKVWLLKPTDNKLSLEQSNSLSINLQETHQSKSGAQANIADDDVLPIWDLNSALKRVRKNEKLLTMLINTFVEDIPTLIEDLKAAINEKNLKDVHRIAHTIKGSAGNLSGLHLQEQAGKLEMSIKSERIVNEEVEMVYQATDELIEELNQYLNKSINE